MIKRPIFSLNMTGQWNKLNIKYKIFVIIKTKNPELTLRVTSFIVLAI